MLSWVTQPTTDRGRIVALRGEISASYAAEATREQCDLALALRVLYAASEPINMRALGKHLQYSTAAISHYLHARRIPPTGVILKLYDLALARQSLRGVTKLPYSVGDLRLLEAAARGWPARDPVAAAPPPVRRGDRRNGPADTAPAARGYRRNDNRPVPDVVHAASRGRHRHLIGSLLSASPTDRVAALWHLGGELSSEELAEFCAALTQAGLRDEVDALLNGALARGKDLVGVIRTLLVA
ncbi:hypothetical protein [Kribbella soli]|uniref:Uncharacterized protein n=1 Tax=Kribbella soli TaxID=1124743 RepID=A0A4R0H9H4_9ACTN|nr:hypothetical protein [Kribbella soli]TCC07625.1 hypothetical protein E0H45_16805 [Kribbella soli]